MILLRHEDEPTSARTAHTDDGLPKSLANTTVTALSEPVESSLSLYPNPLTEGPLTAKIDGRAEPLEVQVYDAEGTLLIRRPANGQRHMVFLREELGSGVRLVKVITSDETVTRKVVIP